MGMGRNPRKVALRMAELAKREVHGFHHDSTNEAEVNKLRACLMVLDATIYCLLTGVSPAWAETFKGQIQAAKDAYESATGEESMIGFKRERK
jgi:hypothetical protein